MATGRLSHGEVRSPTVFKSIQNQFLTARISLRLSSRIRDFGFMFEDWTDADRLATSADTVVQLKALGDTMRDTAAGATGGAPDDGTGAIPAAYTYFGQFVDHDITLDETSADIEQLSDPGLMPKTSLNNIKNTRTATLDLDSVYDGLRDPDDNRKMKVGPVVLLNGSPPFTARPAGKSDLNDLPRLGRDTDPRLDRAAQIGDPRNDENIIVAQMHVAFLKAHNSLIAQGLDFDGAQKALRLRYQSIVLDDYLGRVCDPAIHAEVIANGPKHFVVQTDFDLFMPVEFAFACYRFGHSMVRRNYDYNLNFENIGLDVLFSFTALSGQIGQVVAPEGFETVPDNWIIEWERLLDVTAQPPQRARLIDTLLTNFLFELRTFGKPEGEGQPPNVMEVAPMLARRNLLRGYLIGLPTGQALARRFGLVPLEGDALLAALPTEAMKTAAAPFKEKTPLWFYILAEAGNPNGPGGKHLGPLGSTVLMEVFFNLAKHAPTSIFDSQQDTAFRPFRLRDLIALAAKLDPST